MAEFPYLGIIGQYQYMKVELKRSVAIQGMQENWILAIMPKYGNSAPSSQKWNFSKKNSFF